MTPSAMTLTVAADPLDPQRLVARSDDPRTLAQIADRLLRALSEPGDTLGGWALHPSEQDGGRESAYREERSLVPYTAIVEVIELARPRQRRVVWIDRYHLLVRGAPPEVGGPLSGLYVGGQGILCLYVHHPSAAHPVSDLVTRLPYSGHNQWDEPHTVAQCRYAMRIDAQEPSLVRIACTPLLTPRALQALRVVQ